MSTEHHHHHSNYSGGIGLGTIAAAVLSWTTWHSVGWAIVHAIFGWLYVIYYLIAYGWPFG